MARRDALKAEQQLGGTRSPAGGSHEQYRLAWWYEALWSVGAEGGAGLVQLQGAEEVFAEVAVLTGRRLWLARHGRHVCIAAG
jgi:hypothetical protein